MILGRAITALLAASAFVVGVPQAATAAPDALRTYLLPGTDVFPEGVAVRDGLYYVTSTNDGTVYRGDLQRPRAKVFLPAGQDGRTAAVGIKATASRLVVAGGGTGLVSVYNRQTGARVAQFGNDPSGPRTFVNDIAIAPNGDAYGTDSFRPVLYRIPAAGLTRTVAGVQPLPVFRSFAGTPLVYQDGFNGNGIVVTSDARFLIVGQSNTGKLFRLRLGDKQVTEVALRVRLTNNDGLVLLDSRVLYVVRNGGRVSEIRLAATYDSGTSLSITRDPDFNNPTTAAVAGDRLLIVNILARPSDGAWFLTSIPLP